MASFSFDVVIVGASFGGVAAALAAATLPGVSVALLESTDWVGGQATGQGVTRWDETAASLTETTGSTKSYRDLRNAIRAKYPMSVRSDVGKRQVYFNPGFSRVGPPFPSDGHPFTADPQVVRQILEDMLNEARVVVKLRTAVTDVTLDGHRLASVTTGGDIYAGQIFLDATDLGELLPRCGLRWVIGAESVANTGEKNAEPAARPDWIQPITVPLAVIWRDPHEDHRIPKPAGYDALRAAQGFSIDEGPDGGFDSGGDIRVMYDASSLGDTMFNYRQFIDAMNYSDGRPGRTTLNCAGNDYFAATIPAYPPSPSVDSKTIAGARAASIAFLYYLQNDAPRSDGNGNGYPNLEIDTTAFGTADGTAPVPYIRESRRLADPYVRIVQHDIDVREFDGGILPPKLELGSPGPRARIFEDSCGIGQYAADVHAGGYKYNPPRTIGTPWVGVDTAPFQIPLGALLPRELDNYIASCKNIGTTHVTSGAYRVHPIEWAIGDAAGTLASYCVSENLVTSNVLNGTHLSTYQRRLLERGTPIFWWDDVRFEDDGDAFAAIHLLGVRSIFVGNGVDRNFSPQADFLQSDRDAIDLRINRALPWPDGPMKRFEAAIFICQELGL